MNRQRIFEIISSPENIKYEPDLPLVKELIESFPYFPTPHVILAKLLHDENSIYFDKNLKLSAAYIGNREILYHYLKGQSHTTPAKEISTDKHNELTINPGSENALIEMSVPGSGNIEVNISHTEEIPSGIVTTTPVVNEPEKITVSEDLPAANDIVKIKEPEKILDSRSELEKEMFSYASFDYLSQFYQQEGKPLAVKEPAPAKQQFDIPDAVPQQEFSFSEWFDLLETRHKYTGNKSEIPAESNISRPKSNEVNSLIDKFIQTEPRIKPQQTKMYKPEDMARQSARQDMSIATETLANIYRKQGLNNKAVEIFQQLILKYPQKSGYFANKIREIESEGHS